MSKSISPEARRARRAEARRARPRKLVLHKGWTLRDYQLRALAARLRAVYAHYRMHLIPDLPGVKIDVPLTIVEAP